MSILEKCGAALVAASFVGNLVALAVFLRLSVAIGHSFNNPAKGLSGIVRAFFSGRLRGQFAIVCACGEVDIYSASDRALLSTSGDCKCAPEAEGRAP